ncbi:MAG: DJ-1/PfpI family protein [Chloroflexota bacterium]|nr:MAG: AraC family transcriptional regulator [Chloroflexota bacterium]
MSADEGVRRRSVAILIFDDVELLDFAGPFEVFSSARALTGERQRLMDVFTVAEHDRPVRTRNGLVVQPDYTLANCPPADILVVPGGAGARPLEERPEILGWIRERSAQAELTTSVCTGSFLLARAGLLSGRTATTHWESVPELRERYLDIEVLEDERYVDAGPVVTSAGVSAGIDMALHVVSRLYGPSVARATALGIEYDYWE